MLQRFFEELKNEKDRIIKSWDSDSEEDKYDPAKEPDWKNFLDEAAVDWFSKKFDYESEEGKIYRKLWELTEPEVRLTHPMFNLPGNWDFDNMINLLFEGEYSFIALLLEKNESGILYYEPWAWPFGGTEPLVAFIESLGNTVRYDSWHKGPHKRQKVRWNYEIAKDLVKNGKGFKP